MLCHLQHCNLSEWPKDKRECWRWIIAAAVEWTWPCSCCSYQAVVILRAHPDLTYFLLLLKSSAPATLLSLLLEQHSNKSHLTLNYSKYTQLPITCNQEFQLTLGPKAFLSQLWTEGHQLKDVLWRKLLLTEPRMSQVLREFYLCSYFSIVLLESKSRIMIVFPRHQNGKVNGR